MKIGARSLLPLALSLPIVLIQVGSAAAADWRQLFIFECHAKSRNNSTSDPIIAVLEANLDTVQNIPSSHPKVIQNFTADGRVRISTSNDYIGETVGSLEYRHEEDRGTSIDFTSITSIEGIEATEGLDETYQAPSTLVLDETYQARITTNGAKVRAKYGYRFSDFVRSDSRRRINFIFESAESWINKDVKVGYEGVDIHCKSGRLP